MDSTNIVIKGKYKGYKILFDRNNNYIQLKDKEENIILNDKITSICITKYKLGTENIHYFQMKDSNEKIYCLLDFNIYLHLLILGMKVSSSCILG